MMSEKMYFAETRCDKLTEETVAFAMSTDRLSISPCNDWCSMLRKLDFLTRLWPDPKPLIPCTEVNPHGYPCRVGRLSSMCRSISQSENYLDAKQLSDDLYRILTAKDALYSPRLTGVMIVDARLIFKLWKSDGGYYDIRVLPDINKECGQFDFGLQLKRSASTGVRIDYLYTEKKEHQYVVEWYRKGKIYMAKKICYHPLRRARTEEDSSAHFSGYAETMRVL